MGSSYILRDRSGRTALEALLTVIAISLLLIAAADRFYSGIRPVRETALRVELGTLRSAVNIYALINKRLPDSLGELVEKNIVIPKDSIVGREYAIEFQGRYVEGMTTDALGAPLDPFGKAYGYDPATGRVYCAQAGYESW